jgi:hypothetical protein
MARTPPHRNSLTFDEATAQEGAQFLRSDKYRRNASCHEGMATP